MCIRDSFRPVPEYAVYTNIIKKSRFFSNTGVYFVLLTKIISVSYTHLRAHETVLDIVCRLLLEKKNMKKRKIQKKKKKRSYDELCVTNNHKHT
mgnify:CR=1 FL=1